MTAPGKAAAKQKRIPAGTDHVARSWNTNEQITTTRALRLFLKEATRSPIKMGPKGPIREDLCTVRGRQAPEHGKHCARGGTRTGCQTLRIRLSPEIIADPAQSGTVRPGPKPGVCTLCTPRVRVASRSPSLCAAARAREQFNSHLQAPCPSVNAGSSFGMREPYAAFHGKCSGCSSEGGGSPVRS